MYLHNEYEGTFLKMALDWGFSALGGWEVVGFKASCGVLHRENLP